MLSRLSTVSYTHLMGGVLLAGIIMGLASAGLLGALSTLFSVG